MSNQLQPVIADNQTLEDTPGSNLRSYRQRGLVIKALVLLTVFALGGGGGYVIGRQSMHMAATNSVQSQADAMTLMQEVNPTDGYEIQSFFGDVGPKLIASGAIDMIKFAALYQQQNAPLTDSQMSIMTKESVDNVMINQENAAFLLNFFWALGLTNHNVILTDGPMMSGGVDKVGGFASTGGWTLEV